MVWLAVDSDGTEHMFVRPVVRYRHSAKENSTLVLSIADINNPADIWVEDYTGEDIGRFGIYSPRIRLPAGVIEKIIGHRLKWEDDAVKIE
ncbi:hypothetical protein [Bacteroides nordii]|jgi:hypothetical protein|uniref:hypothetical protein n=1 Tax=Bacteroides nordii TaxID=291645 RepID=UPI0018AB4A4A|nr:hypothetical protein [Bacteroides nordii]